ncbi:MAG: hypothetical protein J7L61_00770 [Thermoplasmata archaeon]|nr:hypothetical protein [Thermoplasmata archaeon]
MTGVQPIPPPVPIPHVRGDRGPSPRFTTLHLYAALLLVGEMEPVSRGSLAAAMDVGEGTIRSILGRLADLGMVEVRRNGVRLTSRGRDVVRLLPFGDVDVRGLTVSERNVAFLVRRAASRVANGVEQRDAAIMAGADGATTLVVSGGRLSAPGLPGAGEGDLATLEAVFPLEEGDVVVVGSARSRILAFYGGLAAALSLLGWLGGDGRVARFL